ncbi:hypothetical protein PRIPAC_79483 [Pristionchus pacificus]|uniref:Uncharacterized protein n=1 Tax=Pristionchus pacificus TaxID=54126 RepID=A0A2A6C467_PRIPA|nr:hypothetical protein PRIPAC_79483 [Pristionchus pacificus]|eukprot:PDM72811.1 hypothetical protein PRIPAC_39245 [Pristionchus pacificus]
MNVVFRIYSSIVADFQSGIRKLVLNEADNYFTSEEIPIVVGSPSSIVWQPSALDSLKQVCGDQSLVGLFYECDIYGFYATTLTEDCFLTKLQTLNYDQYRQLGTKRSVWLTHSIREGDSYFYIINRNIPRIIMEKINWALLTMFTQDNMNGFLRNRNIDTHSFVLASTQEEILSKLKELPPFTIIGFKQITVPFKILGGGLFLSLLVFIFENISIRVKIVRPTLCPV